MYKSPVSKLLKFFPESRDRWKAKCQQAKQANKKLANQVRAVEKSREHWRQAAQEAQRLSAQYQQELEALKNTAAAGCGQPPIDLLGPPVPRHAYTAGAIRLYLRLVMGGHGLRAAA